jgi:hypothetical protein
MSLWERDEIIICPLHNYYRPVKSRRMRWGGYVVCMKEMRNPYNILVRKPEGKNHLEDLGIDGKVILKCILKKQDVRMGTKFIFLGIGTSGMLL